MKIEVSIALKILSLDEGTISNSEW